MKMDWDKIDLHDPNVIMHMYRGEVQRINAWRRRMDRTTNWSIVITVGVITFSLSNPNVPHWTVLPGLFLAYVLLFTEARRYRHYDSWRARVRALEELFLAKFFDRDMEIDDKWQKVLSEDLRNPRYKIGWREAVKRRLKRIYIWIILVFSVSWMGKIFMHPERVISWKVFFDRISGPLGTSFGVLIFSVIMGTIFLPVFYFFLVSREREAKGMTKEKRIDGKFASEEYIESFEE